MAAYVTGTVNTLADLVTAINSACTANGWTLTADVISRVGVFVRIRVVSGTIEFLGGTGIDGSNNLTGGAPSIVRIRPFAQAFTFPMTYEVHINTAPDEVFVVVNYAVDFWQWAWWGKSSVAGLPGTGAWITAPQGTNTDQSISISSTGSNNGPSHSCCPFGPNSANGFNSITNAYIQHGLDSETWNPQTITPTNPGGVGLQTLQASLLFTQPNAWNNETVLLPIHVWRGRSSGNKISMVADIANARWCRIDFHDPGEIITIGSDSWKLYPFYRKDAVNRNAGNGIQHSGTLAFALRYAGP